MSLTPAVVSDAREKMEELGLSFFGYARFGRTDEYEV